MGIHYETGVSNKEPDIKKMDQEPWTTGRPIDLEEVREMSKRIGGIERPEQARPFLVQFKMSQEDTDDIIRRVKENIAKELGKALRRSGL